MVCSRSLQEADGLPAVVNQVTVGQIVGNSDLIGTGEVHDICEEVRAGNGPCGVGGEVEEHQFRSRSHLLRNSFQIGQKAVFGSKRHTMRDCTGQRHAGPVVRVARGGHKIKVALIQQAEADLLKAKHGANQDADLCVRVESDFVLASIHARPRPP